MMCLFTSLALIIMRRPTHSLVVMRRPTHALVVVRWTALKVGRVEIGRWLKITTGRPEVAVRGSEIRVAVGWREIRVAIGRGSEIRVAVRWRRSEIIPLRWRAEAGGWAGKIRI